MLLNICLSLCLLNIPINVFIGHWIELNISWNCNRNIKTCDVTNVASLENKN